MGDGRTDIEIEVADGGVVQLSAQCTKFEIKKLKTNEMKMKLVLSSFLHFEFNWKIL